MNNKTPWIMLIAIFFIAGTIAVTTVTDQQIETPNILFGDTSGEFNETAPNRPLTDNNNENLIVTVCSSGCDYSTIQEAVNNAALVMRNQHTIQIHDGTYAEDVYIPPIINSQTTQNEGSVSAFNILGNSSDNEGVKVKSFQVGSCLGANAININNLNVYGQEPTSDENASVSIYGCSVTQLKGVNFSGTVEYAVLAYGSSDVQIVNSSFSGNQQHAVFSKSLSRVSFGDPGLNGGSNNGSVKAELFKVGRGSWIDYQDSTVAFVGSLLESDSRGLLVNTDTGTLHNIQNFGNLIDYSIDDDSNYALTLQNTGTNGRALDIKTSIGNQVLLANDIQVGVGANVRFILNANTSSMACVAGNIYYDGSTNKHYGCNGTNWNALY